MGLSIDVDVDIDKDASKAVRNAHESRLMAAASKGFAVSQHRVPEDRGNLRRSGFPPEKRKRGEIVWGYTAPYAAAQEDGTKPYTPPLRPLLEWADRTFSPERTADEVLADLEENGWHPGIFTHPGAAVWSKIRSEGLDGTPYAKPGKQAQEGYLRTHSFETYLNREL